MLGLLINEKEHNELNYLIKRELEELLFDMEGPYIDDKDRKSMQKRYNTLFQLLRRVASEQECLKYIPRQYEQK